MNKNTLFTGDCLYVLNGINSESVDLIYLDPPFNSKRFYSASEGSKAAGASFKDVWAWEDVDKVYLERMVSDYPYLMQFIEFVSRIHGKSMMAYLAYMAQRISEMYRVLKSTGSLYLHCDPTASHYLKIILDMIFDKSNFRNEIVWHYEKWTVPSKSLQRNHDVILVYSKSKEYTFNVQKKLTEHLKKLYERGYSIGGGYGSNGLVIYDKENSRVKEMIKSGKYKVHYAGKEGKPLSDVWSIPFLNSQSNERTGYPTQKPLALLECVIKTSSNEGDIVLDPFCGCATTCVAAQQLQRRWIGIDINKESSRIVIDRLSDDAGLFKDFIHRTDLPKRADL